MQQGVKEEFMKNFSELKESEMNKVANFFSFLNENQLDLDSVLKDQEKALT